MSSDDDLIRYLRDPYIVFTMGHREQAAARLIQQATLLEQQAAEIERLQQTVLSMAEHRDELFDQLARLRSPQWVDEAMRLAERYADLKTHGDGGYHWSEVADGAHARAALHTHLTGATHD